MAAATMRPRPSASLLAASCARWVSLTVKRSARNARTATASPDQAVMTSDILQVDLEVCRKSAFAAPRPPTQVQPRGTRLAGPRDALTAGPGLRARRISERSAAPEAPTVEGRTQTDRRARARSPTVVRST